MGGPKKLWFANTPFFFFDRSSDELRRSRAAGRSASAGCFKVGRPLPASQKREVKSHIPA
jgi:hypothetical protein